MQFTYTKQYSEVISTATHCKPSWSNHNKVLFHAFNPNGILARRSASDDRIRSLVDSGFAKSGALLAFGSLCNYHVQKLYDCALKSRVSHHEATYYVKQIEREIAAADAFIDSIAACI